MDQLTAKDQKKVFVCLVLYITALIASNTLGIKTMPFIFGTHLSVSVFYFPIVFIMTDVIGEVYGKALAKQFVYAGFIAVIAFMIFNIISILLPWSAASMWAHDGYNSLFGLSVRFSIASVLAFIIGEYQDVLAFFFFKAKQGANYFWLRSNLSNVWSQFWDTVIFMTIAFAGNPHYSTHTLILMIIAWWIYKVIMGIVFTPLSYLGIRILRGKNDQSNQTKQA